MSSDKACSLRWTFVQTAFLLLPILLCLPQTTTAQGDVDGYSNLGRGSCQDSRGKSYSYLQRTILFPDPNTCAGECARWTNMEFYRGFEYSVAKRCTCLFDNDGVPGVQNSAENPEYVSRMNDGFGSVEGISGTPGGWCYKNSKNSGNIVGATGTFYAVITLASTALYMLS